MLWIMLLFLGSWTAFELVWGNFFNGAGGILGMLTLATVTVHANKSEERHQEVMQSHQDLRDSHEELKELVKQAPKQ